MSVGAQRLREDADRLRAGAIAKREDPALVDVAIAADTQRRELSAEVDALRAEKKARSAEVGALLAAKTAADDPKVVELKAASQAIATKLVGLEERLAAAEGALDDALLRIPNPPDLDIPVGGSEANTTIRTWVPKGHPPIGADGSDPATGAAPEHDVVGERLGIFDLERGAKVAGTAFPAYRGDGAALIRGLINLFLDTHVRENGFTEIWSPILINEASARGTGQIPDKEDQMYVVGRDGFYLAPTAEVPVTNIFRDETLDADRPDSVRMSAEAAAAVGMRALKALGYSEEDAKIVVDQLIDNALCGYRFASLPRILAIATDPKHLKGRQPIKIDHETPLSALMNGNNNIGYVTCYRAAMLAAEKAKKSEIEEALRMVEALYRAWSLQTGHPYHRE